MTKKEKTIAKYVALLNDLKKKCMAGEEISVRAFCKSHNAGHMSVKAAQHFGYVKKIGVRKFRWMVSGDVTPIMAKCITDWNFEYTQKSIEKKRIAETEDIGHRVTVRIIDDVDTSKDDCEITKLKYQAMLDHQKIVDLETSIKNCELALKNAKMDAVNAKLSLRSSEDSLIWKIQQKDQMIEDLESKLDYLHDQITIKDSEIESLLNMINQTPTVMYYLFGIPVWKRKEKVSR